MNSFKYYSNLDSHPFTGERKVNFKAKVTEKESLKNRLYAFRHKLKNYVLSEGMVPGVDH